MDSECDYLIYDPKKTREGDLSQPDVCLHCQNIPTQHIKMTCEEPFETSRIQLEQALMGSMVPYIEIFEVSTPEESVNTLRYETSKSCSVTYVEDERLVSLSGEMHLRDLPPNGTWLAHESQCEASVIRLRQAGVMCVHAPELHRIVLEHKNDDGLLYLTNKWLLRKENLSEGIQLFGPFVCDAMLAPVLQHVLRSEWLEERKRSRETNNILKLGWAEDFYEWETLPKNASGVLVLDRYLKCKHTGAQYDVTLQILDKMRLCGYTPWSTVQAIRCCEPTLIDTEKLECHTCRSRLLASCVYLMECAAVEASREQDWLVRNEAVIQLCWLLYHIHKPEHKAVGNVIRAWTRCIVKHSVAFHDYKAKSSKALDVDTAVMLFANDHLPELDNVQFARWLVPETSKSTPDQLLLDHITQNRRFSSKKNSTVRPTSGKRDFRIQTAVDVLASVPASAEARADEPKVIAHALVSCFPRVASSALHQLTVEVPDTSVSTGHIWPIYVNPTRACYQLFRSLALPLRPSPVYILELLARGWRHVSLQVLQRFIPMSTGGTVEISTAHHTKYFRNPVDLLVAQNLISESEGRSVIESISKGTLPCFACQSESIPDMLISSTLAFTFAASGIRVSTTEILKECSVIGHIAVTKAGLLYFAAWYVLVYISALHTRPTLRARLAQTGSDADRRACSAISWDHSEGQPKHYGHLLKKTDVLLALRYVFSGLLTDGTILRIAEFYTPELLVQLVYMNKLKRSPCTLKQAMEFRDAWFSAEHLKKSPDENLNLPEFFYLGNLSHGYYSTIAATLTDYYGRPIAQSLQGRDRDFNPWCSTLWVCDEDHNDFGHHKGETHDCKGETASQHYDDDEGKVVSKENQQHEKQKEKRKATKIKQRENCPNHIQDPPSISNDDDDTNEHYTVLMTTPLFRDIQPKVS